MTLKTLVVFFFSKNDNNIEKQQQLNISINPEFHNQCIPNGQI